MFEVIKKNIFCLFEAVQHAQLENVLCASICFKVLNSKIFRMLFLILLNKSFLFCTF